MQVEGKEGTNKRISVCNKEMAFDNRLQLLAGGLQQFVKLVRKQACTSATLLLLSFGISWIAKWKEQDRHKRNRL